MLSSCDVGRPQFRATRRRRGSMARPPLTALCSLFAMTALAAGLGAARADVFPDLDQGWSEPQQRTWYDATGLPRPSVLAQRRSSSQAARARSLPTTTSPVRYLSDGGRLAGRLCHRRPGRQTLSRHQAALEGGTGRPRALGGPQLPGLPHRPSVPFGGQRQRVSGGPTLADFQGCRGLQPAPSPRPATTPRSSAASPTACWVGRDTSSAPVAPGRLARARS